MFSFKRIALVIMSLCSNITVTKREAGTRPVITGLVMLFVCRMWTLGLSNRKVVEYFKWDLIVHFNKTWKTVVLEAMQIMMAPLKRFQERRELVVA